LADGGLVEVAVDGGPGDAEQVSDLSDGAVAGVVELLGVTSLRWGEFGPAAADAATGSGV
jgi:hypothetical protein